MADEDIEAKRRVRNEFLIALYRATKANTHALVNMADIALQIGIQPTDASTVALYLKDSGFLELRTMGGGLSITRHGIDAAEDLLTQRSSPTTDVHAKTVLPQSDTSKRESHQRTTSDAYRGESLSRAAVPALGQVVVMTKAIKDSSPNVADDALGYVDYADAIADFLRDPQTSAPLTIAINGPWGSGKTTLMRWISEKLQGNARFQPVWLSAWKYSTREMVWAGIAISLHEKLSDLPSQLDLISQRFSEASWWKPFVLSIMFGVPLFSLVYYFGQDHFAWVVAAVGASLPILSGIYKGVLGPFKYLAKSALGPNFQTTLGFQEEFQSELRRCVRTLAKKGRPILFVDDLDRASPQVVTEIFEAISLVLGEEGCFFVLGFDAEIVGAAIQTKYKEVIETLNKSNPSHRFLGNHFIEKLVQVNFSLPKPTPSQFQYLVTQSTMDTTQPATTAVRARSAQLNDEAAKRTSVGSSGQISHISESPHFVDALKLATSFLTPNPRTLKRFVNSFRLLCHIANRRGLFRDPKFDISTLALLVLFEIEYPEIYEDMVSSGSTVICTKIINWLSGTEEASELPTYISRNQGRYERIENALYHFWDDSVELMPYLSLASLLVADTVPITVKVGGVEVA